MNIPPAKDDPQQPILQYASADVGSGSSIFRASRNFNFGHGYVFAVHVVGDSLWCIRTSNLFSLVFYIQIATALLYTYYVLRTRIAGFSNGLFGIQVATILLIIPIGFIIRHVLIWLGLSKPLRLHFDDIGALRQALKADIYNHRIPILDIVDPVIRKTGLLGGYKVVLQLTKTIGVRQKITYRFHRAKDVTNAIELLSVVLPNLRVEVKFNAENSRYMPIDPADQQ